MIKTVLKKIYIHISVCKYMDVAFGPDEYQSDQNDVTELDGVP